MRFIDKCILKFFNKLYAKKVVELTVPKKEVTVVLPFMGSTSLKLKNELVKCCQNILPFCNIKVVFKTTSKLGDHCRYKDVFPKSLISGVIHQFSCAKCKLVYIGSAKRYWEKRL